jgi:hypothetical protein
MIKMIKMAFILLISTTSFALAAPKVSGSLAHQFQKQDSVDNGYVVNTKVILKTAGSVNDKISYTVSYGALDHGQNDSVGTPSLNLSNAKFIAKAGISTFVIGRQGLTTPWTNGSSLIDGTQVGNGIVGLVPVNNVMLIGTYIVNHNISKPTIVGTTSDIAIIGALSKIGSANIEAWYSLIGEDEQGTGVTDDDKGLSAMTFASSVNIEGVNLKARYSSVSPKIDTIKTQTLLSLEASAKINGMTFNAGLARAGDDGDLVSLDEKAGTSNDIYAGTWNLALGQGDNNGATLASFGITKRVNEVLTSNINYAQKTGDDINDATEVKAQFSANIAKNMSLYLRVAKVTFDTNTDEDYLRTRLYASYKF